jgi:hypothetical protein
MGRFLAEPGLRVFHLVRASCHACGHKEVIPNTSPLFHVFAERSAGGGIEAVTGEKF